ncbi:MAG: class I tRNA ligase family protein, partial [Deltaproteobacteria bacterium]|nr:class I tRNA ligase family protein [Deltaproteobacteria bacterium]
LHTHVVDKITFPCENCGSIKKRVSEVLDCWFESGSMPYAQCHYPFENKEIFERSFPADFIAEGMDQTRGWFYTLLVLGVHLRQTAPFKNVVVNGIVLAEDGKKMSKRLKNYPDPIYIIDSYGADALRLYLINSPVVKGENLRFSENGVKETVRKVLLPLWNAYSFFVNYALIDNFRPEIYPFFEFTNPLDGWIISRLNRLIGSVDREMKQYRLYKVVPALLDFIDDLTNWYIRRSRRRFWSNDNKDKTEGYYALFTCLFELTKLLAPFAPFVTEHIYQNLKSLFTNSAESVHFLDLPKPQVDLINDDLEKEMELVRQLVETGRSLRSRLNIKLRQPLNSITIMSRDETIHKVAEKFHEAIKDELNVKRVEVDQAEENYVSFKVRPVTPVLGPVLGERLKNLIVALSKLSKDEVYSIERNGFYNFDGEKISLENLLIERIPLDPSNCESFKNFTIRYDTKIDETLYHEMLAREFVNRIQKYRKEIDLELTDRIKLTVSCSDQLLRAIERFKNFIMDETLAIELKADPFVRNGQVTEIEGLECVMRIEKVS